MNRKIKFRGKTLETKTLFKDTIAAKGEWVYGGIVDHIGGVHILQSDSQYAFFSIRVIPETVGQFTGLYDKNGVEIYEGDIIRLDDEYRKLISSTDAKTEEELCRRDCVVGFKDGAFMFGRNRFKVNDFDSYLWLTSSYCEVIGNVYESEVTNDNYN